ncbi:MAG: hypothetical protein RL711_1786 [Bacteroidota bacterium]|jgi:hypothetical protein
MPKPKLLASCEHGFMVGYGYGIDTFNIFEGNYRPIFIMYRTAMYSPRVKVDLNRKLKFRIYSEYQFNPVMVYKNEHNTWTFDCGISNGLQVLYTLKPKLQLYALIGSGLHYADVITVRQKRGWLFSDNMDAGFYYYLSDTWAINFSFRIRHMSNAQIWMPNHGINTTNFLIGMSKIIPNR